MLWNCTAASAPEERRVATSARKGESETQETMIASTKIGFGTDGWRAVMAREFTFDNVALVAQAIADYVNSTGKAHKGIIIGYDARFLSDQFATLVADVLGANGIPALVPDRDTPTPVVAYTILARDLAGAIMLTASHNPPEYNGIKFIPDYLHPALPDITDAITARIQELQADRDQIKTGGPKPEIIDPKPDYVKRIAELIDLKAIGAARLTLCVDPLYASGRGYLSDILESAGATVYTLHNERNPLFGGSLPEPNEKNLRELSALVVEKKAALGLSMDGDADRFGILADTGQYLTSNEVIALAFYHWAKTREPHGSVARSVATSGMLDALAKHFGMSVTETPVGFKWIGNALRTTDAIIGGEGVRRSFRQRPYSGKGWNRRRPNYHGDGSENGKKRAGNSRGDSRNHRRLPDHPRRCPPDRCLQVRPSHPPARTNADRTGRPGKSSRPRKWMASKWCARTVPGFLFVPPGRNPWCAATSKPAPRRV